MDIPIPKRYEYWNHFIERWALEARGPDPRITPLKLKRLKPLIIQDDNFWTTVLFHHQGHHHPPEDLVREDQPNYIRCQEAFWLQILNALFRHGMLP